MAELFRLQDRLNQQLQTTADSYKTKSAYLGDIRFALDNADLVNDWELDFLTGLAGYSTLSDKQRAKLSVIVRKVTAALALPRLQRERRRHIR